jgi:hypothetical protein
MIALGTHDFGWSAHERRPPGQGHEQHDAKRVPVRLGTNVLVGQLLGRHEQRSAAHERCGMGVEHRMANLRDEPEVEQHEVAIVAHQHVGRLDIAMDATRAVDGGDRRRQLAQCAAQAPFVVGAPRRSGKQPRKG